MKEKIPIVEDEEEGIASLVHSILEKPNDLSPFTLSAIIKSALLSAGHK